MTKKASWDLVNERGLFASSYSVRIHITEARLRALKGAIDGPELAERPDWKEALRAYLAAAESLPVKPMYLHWDERDREDGYVDERAKGAGGIRGYSRDVPCHVGWIPTGWAGGSPIYGRLTDISAEDYKKMLLALEVMARNLPKANGAADLLGYPLLRSEGLKGCKDLAKKLKGWVFKDAGAHQKATADTCFAIWRGEKEGYLCKDGGYRELSSAQIFSSEAAASRTVGSQRANNSVVVEISLKPVRIVKEFGAPERSVIDGVMAQAEADELNRALEAASIEALRARVEAIEALEPKRSEPGRRSNSL